MQEMSPSLLLRKRMSSGTLEEEDEWTQAEVHQKNKIKIHYSEILSSIFYKEQ